MGPIDGILTEVSDINHSKNYLVETSGTPPEHIRCSTIAQLHTLPPRTYMHTAYTPRNPQRITLNHGGTSFAFKLFTVQFVRFKMALDHVLKTVIFTDPLTQPPGMS